MSFILSALLLLAPPAHARPKKIFGLLTGVDLHAENGFFELQGKKIGLITDAGAKARDGRTTAEILAATPGVTLLRVFAPGRPQPSDLEGLDALIYDVPNTGSRQRPDFTAIGSALEESAKAKVPLIVFDRPNPLNGLTTEGPLLNDPGLPIPVPLRHGLTVGELATLRNELVGHPGLQIVKMKGWSREQWQQTPERDVLLLESGVSLFAAANVSIGEGTEAHLQWVGAPWLDARAVLERLKKAKLPGLDFSIEEHTPAQGAHAGVACRGIRVAITEPNAARPVWLIAHLAQALRQRHPGQFLWNWAQAKQILGNDGFQKLYEKATPAEEIIKVFERGPRHYEEIRKPYLLY